MSGFVFDQGNLNTTALKTPGAYVQLMNPSGLALPGLSNAVAELGTASWGPVNQVTGPYGTPGEAAAVYGDFNANLYLGGDRYDLMRAVYQTLQQGQTTVSLNLFCNRISDGTEVAASVALKDVTAVTPLTGMTIVGKWTGVAGNKINILIDAAGPANLYNVTIVANFAGAIQSEQYLNIAGSSSGASPFWVNFANAIANGNQSRGPSQLLGTPTGVSTTALNPAVGSFALTGGTDGRSGVTSSSCFGSDVVGNRQGIFAFRGMAIVPAYVYCAGLTDTTKCASVQAFCFQEIVRYVFPLVGSTSTPSAVTTRSTLGISDKRFMYAKDWIKWVDPVSGQTLYTDPVAIMIGRAASLSPELSPLNKEVYGVIGSDQTVPYPGDEIGQLVSNGIWVIANPCLGAAKWGIASSSTTSLNPIEQPVEYERLKDYIGIEFVRILQKYVGGKQGPYDPDPSRSACKLDLDSFGRILYDGAIIADWQSQCDAKLNNPNSVQAGYMFGKFDYIPYTGIKFVVLNLGTASTLSAGQAYALASAAQGG